MITMKEYASSRGISYEAVRSQVNKYANDLKDHVIKDGRTRFLDDEAIRILDTHRSGNPHMIDNKDTIDELNTLKEINENLRLKVIDLEDKLNEAKDKIIEATDKANATYEKYVALLEMKNDEPHSQTDELHSEGDELQQTSDEVPDQGVQEPKRATIGQRLKYFITGRLDT